MTGREGGRVSSILNMINHAVAGDYPEDMSGQKAAVTGGAVGLDVVEYFAPRGAEVSIVKMMPVIENGIDPVSKAGTFNLMEKHGVKQLTNTALLEVKEQAFLVKNPDGSETDLPFDYGFVCLGIRANNPVLDQLRETFNDGQTEVMNIGDSVRARRIIESTEEARNILNVLDKRDFI